MKFILAIAFAIPAVVVASGPAEWIPFTEPVEVLLKRKADMKEDFIMRTSHLKYLNGELGRAICRRETILNLKKKIMNGDSTEKESMFMWVTNVVLGFMPKDTKQSQTLLNHQFEEATRICFSVESAVGRLSPTIELIVKQNGAASTLESLLALFRGEVKFIQNVRILIMEAQSAISEYTIHNERLIWELRTRLPNLLLRLRSEVNHLTRVDEGRLQMTVQKKVLMWKINRYQKILTELT
jgi:hypothetical protein